MASSTPPTVRPYRPHGGSAESTVAGLMDRDREMLSPLTDPDAGVQQRDFRRRRVGWLLVLSLVALILGGSAISTSPDATARPATHQPDPCAGDDPRPTTCPPTPNLPAPTTLLPEACHSNPLPYCFPSTTPALPATTSAPSTCSNLEPDQPRPPDCIPQPTTPPSDNGPQQPGTEGGGDGSECGITDIGACITEAINALFRGLVEAALSPILDLLGRTVLSTPTIDSLPGIGELWNNSFELVVAAYGLFVLIGGILVMGHESIQTRYSIKEIGPRIPAAFLASALSLFFADKLIQLANALTQGVLGDGVKPPSLGDTFSEAIAALESGGLFIILTGLVLVIVGIGLLIVYVIRVVVTLILIASGPLFLLCHALPHTDPLARWWWKAITAVLAIQIAQALVLITAVRTFLTGGVQLFGSVLSAFGMMIAAIALFYILFKIPFWLLSAVKVSSGRSLLGGLARAYVAAKTFGMVTGNTRAVNTASVVGAASSHRNGSGRGAGSGRGGGGVPNPYAHPRTAANGQYVLPLPGLRRTRATATATATSGPVPKSSAPKARQLALPLGNDWPENRPVLGRDRQYRLPLNIQRTSPPPVSNTGSGTRVRHPARPGRQQLELPLDPYKGNRPTRSGQYPLPLDGVRRVPPPKPVSTPAEPRRSTPRTGRQLRLPLDLPKPSLRRASRDVARSRPIASPDRSTDETDE